MFSIFCFVLVFQEEITVSSQAWLSIWLTDVTDK